MSDAVWSPPHHTPVTTDETAFLLCMGLWSCNPSFPKVKQEDHKFKANPRKGARSSLKTNKQQANTTEAEAS